MSCDVKTDNLRMETNCRNHKAIITSSIFKEMVLIGVRCTNFANRKKLRRA